MRDNVYYGTLNAYYGSMLTAHQREIMRLYYDCDMSLAEISESLGVSRQAVREIIVRSVAKLTEWEQKLGLISKVQAIADSLEKTIEQADKNSVEEIKNSLRELLAEIREI